MSVLIRKRIGANWAVTKKPVVFLGNPDHDVFRIADQERFPLEAGPRILVEPSSTHARYAFSNP